MKDQCSCCHRELPEGVFNTIADVFCPWCGELLRASQAKLAQPETSSGEQVFWNIIGALAIAFTLKAIGEAFSD